VECKLPTTRIWHSNFISINTIPWSCIFMCACVEDRKCLGWYFVTNQKYSYSCLGMVCSREGIHGKMESMVQTAPSHLGRTSLMCSRWRTRLVATFISPPLACTRLQEASEASKSQAVLSFLYHSLLLPAISQSWLVIGSRRIIQ